MKNFIKKTTLLLTSILLGSLIGCGNTAEGIKKDNEKARQDIASGASNMANDASNSGQQMGIAAVLTPKIKLAISGDKRLNADGNSINVDTTSSNVTLVGHVTSEEMKLLASEITARILKENDAKQTIDNRLEVQSK
ncbi:MAG: BON domain-containing protein [Armatimonadota bacterium]